MDTNFYYNLTQYLKNHDTANANSVIMEELGNILIQDRESFIVLLKYADLPVSGTETDAQLIDIFIHNINKNRKLMIGAAYMVNQKNKKIGFDGQEEVSDAGVKAVHKVMFNYFDAAQPAIGPCFPSKKAPRDEYSNAGGIWGNVANSLANLGGKVVQQQHDKKYGAQDLLVKKQAAKQAMVNQVLKQRAAQKAAADKKVAEKAKLKKILIISGVSLAGLAIIITGVYFATRKK